MKFLLWVTLALLAVPASAQTAPPAYTLIEAEADPHGTVQTDPEALGGAYVRQDGAYQPALIAPLPASGTSWVVWARVKNSNYQLKGVGADGKQTELAWEWNKPAEWAWVNFGRHTRAEMGTQFLLMRGPDATGTPGLDCAVFTESDTFNPGTAIAVPPPPPVTISVDWTKTVAHATSLSYGLNGYGAFNPATTASPAYKANMAHMNPGIVRLHSWDMMQDSKTNPSGWIDTAHKQWDAVKIRKTLTGAFSYGPALLVNIPGWPAWMDADNDGFLDAGQTDAYAAFCAQLVTIINTQTGRHVTYWEVTNEKDGAYYGDFHNNGGALKDPAKPDRVAELAAIYNACAVAMKKADPTIQTGGPAVARPDWTDFDARFAQAAAPNLDFFSYHAYASGSKDDPDTQIFSTAAGFGGTARGLADILHAAMPGRRVPLFFDEYNISWTWQTRDPRMTTVKGAVFDALAVTSTVTGGADVTAAWNDKDGIYGKMDNDFVLRPGGQAFHLFNTFLRGSVVRAVSSEPGAMAAYAVTSGPRRSLLLMNRSGRDRTVSLPAWPARSAGTVCRLTDAGYTETKIASLPASLSVPANSLLLFTSTR